MSRPDLRLSLAAVAIFALSACGGHGPDSTVPLAPMQFQHVQNASESGPVVYTLGDGGANASNLWDLRLGADGKLYWTTNPALSGCPWPTSGEVGNFDVSTHAQTYQTVSYGPSFIQETSNGSVWVEEWNNSSGAPTIDRYAGIGGADTPISIPIGPFSPGCGQGYFGNGIDGGTALGADGAVWFGSSNSPQVGEINQTNNAVSVYTLKTPAGGGLPIPQYMTLGNDKHIWLTDALNDAVFRVATTGTSKGANTYAFLPEHSFYYQPTGIASGPDKRIYAGSFNFSVNPFTGAMASAAADAAPVFTSIPLPLNVAPAQEQYGSVSGKVYFGDIRFEGIGVYDTSTRTLVMLPMVNYAGFSGIAVDKSGATWLSCSTPAGVACVERFALTSTWAVYPSTKINLYTQDLNGNPLPPGLIGLGETGNSGPFTVASSNAKVCTASVISGFDHNIQVNPVAPGKCTLSVTDAHARTVRVFATVINGNGNPQAHVHRIGSGRLLRETLPDPRL